ncbi:aldo/keto reductase [Candidatus Omnitrophus magneticus]|uniref:Aldo/keto reductase n=1 Tax=Candidatus Omnitrophus magneticus TaxID=1609969 RepID=A0A0F0CPL9_9BACT|nr:aldo/keto reductase [Candidatus Omnitrophus magneticus]
MNYNHIKNTDLKISAVSLGSWVFGGEVWGETNDDISIEVIKNAISGGINFIDTAPAYGNGRAETVIGKTLGKTRDILVADKCGLEIDGKSIKINLTPAFIRKDLENSLKRLNRDVIDLYQCHWPDKKTPIEETFSEMNKLQKEGKIRHVGVCNFDKNLLSSAMKISKIVSNQVHYSILNRYIEKELLEFCKNNEISILTYGSLGGGILTGKYKQVPVLEKNDVRNFFYRFYNKMFFEKTEKIIKVLNEISEKHNGFPVETAINWARRDKIVASCIVGARNSGQIKKNISASKWDLSEQEINKIENACNDI